MSAVPTLYVVATPIGNLADLTPRAQDVLRSVAAICAEDTRRSGQLLAHFGIQQPLVALHDHNEEALSQRIVARLLAGESLALVSDAGTPLVTADPDAPASQAIRQAARGIVAATPQELPVLQAAPAMAEPPPVSGTPLPMA